MYERLKVAVPSATGGRAGNGGGSSSSSAAAAAESGAALVAIGAVSKAVATTATYPYQVIKSRLQQRAPPVSVNAAGVAELAPPPFRGFWDAVVQTARHEGPAGFYRGFVANLARVAPQSALTLLVYERIKAGLDAAFPPAPHTEW